MSWLKIAANSSRRWSWLTDFASKRNYWYFHDYTVIERVLWRGDLLRTHKPGYDQAQIAVVIYWSINADAQELFLGKGKRKTNSCSASPAALCQDNEASIQRFNQYGKILSIVTYFISSTIAQFPIVGRMSCDQSDWQTSQAIEQEKSSCSGYFPTVMGILKCVLETVCR